MKYRDKISVIIPTYNRSRTIERSVRSVIDQSYTNLEIIIIDDGSTDNTEDIIKSIKDKRIIYVKQKNAGACAARNHGILISTGKYIAFQDSDDEFLKDKLLMQYQNLIKNHSDLDFCKFTITDNGQYYTVPSHKQQKFIKNNSIITELCFGNFISTQTILTKKNILKKELFDETLPRLQDYDLILRLSTKYNFSFSNHTLINVYRQKDSISNNLPILSDAIKIMLQKKYNLSEVQEKTLHFSLQALLTSEHYRQEIKNNKTQSIIIEQLNQNLTDCQTELNNVLNSKGWKALESARKIIHPFN